MEMKEISEPSMVPRSGPVIPCLFILLASKAEVKEDHRFPTAEATGPVFVAEEAEPADVLAMIVLDWTAVVSVVLTDALSTAAA